MEKRLLARINQKKADLDALRPIPTAIVARLNEQLSAEYIYNSNAIEGNTLTLRETKLILETGITIGGKSLHEHLEVTNHQKALSYVESLLSDTQSLTAFHVRAIHQLVLADDAENAGHYRKVPVRIGGATHEPPEAWELSRLMNEWSIWLATETDQLHAIEAAAIAHHRLAAIHPFVDGNGRTARLVMNLLLMRHGFPPTIVEARNRLQYYRVLDSADKGRTTPLVNFIGRAVERGLTLYLEACKPRMQPPEDEDKWILLRDAAKNTDYSQEYLSLLARRGQLEAIKRGRNWHTTLAAIKKYQDSIESNTT